MRRLLQIALVGSVITALCLLVDESFARWLAGRDTWPNAWAFVIEILEYPVGYEPWKWWGIIAVTAGAIATLFITRWRPYAHLWLLIALTHLLARNISFWIKVLTGRLRPSEWLARDGDTFFRDGGYSFPSGHVVMFASILLPLAFVYPRTRPLLAIVVFVMAARVAVNAHFLSDVFGGLALTAAVTWLSAVVVRRVLPSQILPLSLR